jgi:hypothetical protein
MRGAAAERTQFLLWTDVQRFFLVGDAPTP